MGCLESGQGLSVREGLQLGLEELQLSAIWTQGTHVGKHATVWT